MSYTPISKSRAPDTLDSHAALTEALWFVIELLLEQFDDTSVLSREKYIKLNEALILAKRERERAALEQKEKK